MVSVPGRIKEADGIRGLACLIVLVVHAIAITFPSVYSYLRGTGKLGVWLFFSLSSFLLTHQLLIRGSSPKTLIDYFLGRFLRIFPLFVLSVCLYYFFGTAGIDRTADIVNAITFQQGYSHLWTIPVEFKFYFVLPILVWIGRFVQSYLGWKGILVVTALVTSIHQFYAPYQLLQESTIETFQYFPAFLFGCAAAILRTNYRGNWMDGKATFLGCIILGAIFLTTPFMRYFMFGQAPTDDLLNKYLFFSFVWTVFIFTQVHSSGGFLTSLLTSRFLSAIGLYSYSIYLVHWLILNKMVSYYPEKIVTMIAVVVLSIMAGHVMYTFIEKPLFAVRKSFLDAIEKGWPGIAGKSCR